MKDLETLEKGFVESTLSQIENPCSKIIQGTDPVVSVCDSSDNLTADVGSAGCELSRGELTREVGDGRVEEYVGNGNSEVSHEELAREVGDVGVEDYGMCGGVTDNDQLNNGSYDDVNIEDLTFVLSDGYDLQTSELPSFDGNEEIGFERTFEEKGDSVLHSNEPDSSAAVEVSGNEPDSSAAVEVSDNGGINVFVEVFGPLDGMHESGDDDDNDIIDFGAFLFGESDSDLEFTLEENVNSLSDVKNAPGIEDGDFVGEQVCILNVGDLVWVKTRTQLWWPGMISDPAIAAKGANKSERKGLFLVKYYGSANFVWCSSSDMKPFLEYFEQMSSQNNSNNFIGSVEKALSEIGLRVKSEMTCPCFSKENQTLATQSSSKIKEANSIPMDAVPKYDVQFLSQFAPANFVSSIKHAAQTGTVPGKIDLTILKNCLSAFYSSVGHCQLPMRLLRPSSDTLQDTPNGLTLEVAEKGHHFISEGSRSSVKGHNDDLTISGRKKRNLDDVILDDKITSSGKGFESRERKKSKYLSYPYVNVNRGPDAASTLEKEPKNLKEGSDDPAKSSTAASCSGLSSKIKRSRKPVKEQNIISRADDIDECPAELLSELRSTALDCFHLNRSRYSGALKRFYCSFRKFAFLDVEIASKHSGNLPERDVGKSLLKSSDKVGTKKKGCAGEKDTAKSNSVGEKCPEEDNLHAKANVVRKSGAKKKKKEAKSEGLDSKTESFGTGTNSAPGKSLSEKLPEGDNLKAKANVSKRSSKKKKEEVKSESLDSITDSLVAGTNIIPSKSFGENLPEGDNLQAQANCVSQKRPKKKKEEVKSKALDSLGTQTNIAPTKPCEISFQQSCSEIPGSKRDPETRNEGANPGPLLTGMIAKTDLNQNHLNVPVEGSSTRHGSTLPEKFKGVVSPNINGNEQTMAFASVQSRSKVQGILQNASPLNNNGSRFCTEFKSGESHSNTGLAPSVKRSLSMGIWLASENPEPKKRKRKEEMTDQVASAIPDLNGSVIDTKEGNVMSPEEKLEPKKKRRISNDTDIVQDPGGSLILNFAPPGLFPLPSRETLVATFSRFGLLKESGIQILNDYSNVEIAYERISDAQFAFRSLEKSNPFGESLAAFNLSGVPDLPSKVVKKRKNLQAPTRPSVVGEIRDVATMRQNVETMKMVLEKAGSSISPEMRAKLDSEIKSFLTKLGPMGGSSSS